MIRILTKIKNKFIELKNNYDTDCDYIIKLRVKRNISISKMIIFLAFLCVLILISFIIINPFNWLDLWGGKVSLIAGVGGFSSVIFAAFYKVFLKAFSIKEDVVKIYFNEKYQQIDRKLVLIDKLIYMYGNNIRKIYIGGLGVALVTCLFFIAISSDVSTSNKNITIDKETSYSEKTSSAVIADDKIKRTQASSVPESNVTNETDTVRSNEGILVIESEVETTKTDDEMKINNLVINEETLIDGDWLFDSEHFTYVFSNKEFAKGFYLDSLDNLYFFNDLGHLHLGWLTIGKDKYYFTKNGAYSDGIYMIDDEEYYFYSDAKCAKDSKADNKYLVNSEGAIIRDLPCLEISASNIYTSVTLTISNDGRCPAFLDEEGLIWNTPEDQTTMTLQHIDKNEYGKIIENRIPGQFYMYSNIYFSSSNYIEIKESTKIVFFITYDGQRYKYTGSKADGFQYEEAYN